ncbi:hypothetical protein JOC36_000093 [Weissella uvarum]|uniref:DUF1836 domain-containing protein n=1 Tax=Weissella uvarum TaxID=1479233 RepID=UPI00195F84B6|nr:DUF1836 domain-containing protein [Weissella uvarum]MBM7616560.1 hypothetical protein [Weissella uvarum]MCM0594980.1 DUF1836 domain-containing protein [Weissella uvarum]
MTEQKFTLPRWNELPTLDLYLDQVVSLVNGYVAEIMPANQKRVLTNAMLNNYVKHDLMPAPVKKKYSRQHVVFLILISLMKQAFSLDEVQRVLDLALRDRSLKDFYDEYCDAQEAAVIFVRTAQVENAMALKAHGELSQIVALAIATNLYSKTLIAQLEQDQEHKTL